jgi:cytochrome c biogenesis protein CcdA
VTVDLLAAVAEKGFRFGVVVSALGFGFRHGIDWDHIAAITDITSSQDDRRRSLVYGTLYAMGHALVVLVLGVLAVLVGERFPESVDEAMTRVVGVTLLVLGVYVFVSLVRHGRDFRMRSRWMLIFAGVRKGVRWIRRRARAERTGPEPVRARTMTLDGANELGGGPDGVPVPEWHHGHHGRPGHHHHARPEPDDAFMNYSRWTALGVGMIHGIGAETPTQVLVFLAAAGAGGQVAGIIVLAAFIVGLLASNSLITLGSTFGFLGASKNFPLYAAVAVITGIFSLVIGAIFLLGKTTVLPALFGG